MTPSQILMVLLIVAAAAVRICVAAGVRDCKAGLHKPARTRPYVAYRKPHRYEWPSRTACVKVRGTAEYCPRCEKVHSYTEEAVISTFSAYSWDAERADKFEEFGFVEVGQ